MFTVFVDRTIENLITAADNQRMVSMSVFEAPFEIRLATLKESYGEGLVRTPTYKNCQVKLPDFQKFINNCAWCYHVDTQLKKIAKYLYFLTFDCLNFSILQRQMTYWITD